MALKPIVRLENITKNFHGRHVLDDLSLEIFRGEILVILGKSGSGKSVLLRQIMSLEAPDSGRVVYDPGLLDASGKPDFGKIGLVFQGGALFDFMSVLDNVAFYLTVHCGKKNRKLSDREIGERAFEALTWVGLQEAATLFPSQLSGGMRKRVALARSVVYNPEVLLYDEPTAGLDPVTGGGIGRFIRNLRD
ncbi:MAG: ATP-binding cassette domain-containing protein, partial [Victivallaceae bacterium]